MAQWNSPWPSPREAAFTLGVEWGRAWEASRSAAAWSLQVHAENVDRIVAMLTGQGRRVSVTMNGSDWATIAVAGLD